MTTHPLPVPGCDFVGAISPPRLRDCTDMSWGDLQKMAIYIFRYISCSKGVKSIAQKQDRYDSSVEVEQQWLSRTVVCCVFHKWKGNLHHFQNCHLRDVM